MTDRQGKIETLTAAEIRNILKTKGLSIGGTKAEFVARLKVADPEGEWTSAINVDESNQSQNDVEDTGAASQSHQRERQLMAELRRAQQEIETLRRMRSSECDGATTSQVEQRADERAASPTITTKVNMTTIADLLSYFDGDSERYETWENQVVFLKTAYRMESNMVKLLIGMRLRGKALEWFHSSPAYIQMTADELLAELRDMFYLPPNRIMLRRRFEGRTWQKNETFRDYVHQKIILANRISINEEDVVGYVIEGIPDAHLRDLARAHRFPSKESLLLAFEQITLKDGSHVTTGQKTKFNDDRRKNDKREHTSNVTGEKKEMNDDKKRGMIKRCFNCGSRKHMSVACPEREKGSKCFECNEYGHVASKCPKKNKAEANCLMTKTKTRKQLKNVKINDVLIPAVLDTGSDLTIMRANQYIKLGTPRLICKQTPFRGIGEGTNMTLREFNAKITVDDHTYDILIQVVSDDLSRNALLIGRNFLDEVDLRVKRGKATIIPCSEIFDNDVPEVCKIDAFDECEIDPVDLSSINNEKTRKVVRGMINEYRPIKTREVEVKMTILLKDEEPVYQRARRLSSVEKDDVNAQINEWIQSGIAKSSVLDYASHSAGKEERRVEPNLRRLSCVVLTYIDDVIIPAADCESALMNLRRVLSVASQTGLEINWKKCNFMQRKVEFLGHVIEDGRVQPSQRKTKAVQKFPKPENMRKVQSFLGLTGYFRKFIPGYSLIARPLTNLLRANTKFRFEKDQVNAFERLKVTLSNKPVLSLYRLKAETKLHTDASMHGYGAILLQRDNNDNCLHPVFYASGKTTDLEERYTSYELEVLAVVKALVKFRVYLLGIEFKIVTDCRAFALTMNKKDLCVRVARWALQLEEFNYTIEHRPGRNMAHVDALSRNPLPTCLLVDEDESAVTAKLRRAQETDPEIMRVMWLAEQGKIEGYAIRDGLLFKDDGVDVRLVVPKSMAYQVIRQAHARGHFAAGKTEAIVKRDYWIANLRGKTEKVVCNCIDCILAEKKQGRQEGFLNTIDKGDVPLDTFHVDHLGPLASTKKNYRHIFVVIDSFTKFTWLYTTKSTSTAEVIDKLRKQSIIFGNPRRVVSDRGTAFTSNDFKEYCQRENIQHVLTTTGIPRANGQVERVNRTLIPLLTKLSSPKSDEWYKHLSIAQQYVNTTPSRSTGTTPFQLLFGVQAKLRDDPEIRGLLEEEWITAFQEK
nr:PREDICTED: uncharacterized protein LOC105678149 [Linepithema humile]